VGIKIKNGLTKGFLLFLSDAPKAGDELQNFMLNLTTDPQAKNLHRRPSHLNSICIPFSQHTSMQKMIALAPIL
jgi:hypothetical protein